MSRSLKAEFSFLTLLKRSLRKLKSLPSATERMTTVKSCLSPSMAALK
ncbi:UNVERIFIED_CONTAM: hypothetical protein GTU68_040308 [Idotea baltica]|nr:hypothetical protein [Idotea baltica]